MLPSGWKTAPLGSLASVERGKFSVRPRNDPRYFGGDVPFVQTGDVTNAGMFLRSYSQTLNEKGVSVSRVFAKDTILLTIAANIGATAITVFPVACPDSVVGIKPYQDQADVLWLKYALVSQQKNLDAQASQNAQKNINLEVLKPLRLSAPPLPEQRRIGEILVCWDQAIATTERLLVNSRTQWQALIGITLHLPSANPDPTAPSDNGGFPASVQPGIPTLPTATAGWRRIQLGDHLSEVRRPVVLVDDHTYTLVTVKRSRGGVQLREVLRGLEVKTPSQFYVHADDFLISKRQIVHGACGIVPQELNGAVVSNEYAVLNSDGEIDLRFLRYLSESRYFQQTCFHSSIGVHVEKMIFKTERWLSWPFNIPSLTQQQRIVEILDAAGLEVASIARQLDTLKREKSALMAQLLTGKRRVHLTDAKLEVRV
jgi:type I restriction enzyme S subunit